MVEYRCMNFGLVEDFLVKKREPTFRLQQIREAFFKGSASGFEEILVLPKNLREELSRKFEWLMVKASRVVGGRRVGVVKVRFELSDGKVTESVLMFYRDWITACVSTMSGCPLGCQFCATGQMGFGRNLTAWEIVDQVAFWNQYLRETGAMGSRSYKGRFVSPVVAASYAAEEKSNRVSHVVFMGMGEPFLNWERVWSAIQVINDKDCLGIGQRRLTVSTVGIVPKIYEFADLGTEINLAISLHSPFQDRRGKIMPIAKEHSLNDLFSAARYYVTKTKRKLFFEYALIDGFNDREEDVAALKKWFTEPLFHLNLINLNPTGSDFKPASSARGARFLKWCEEKRIPHTIRRSIGSEINAACGQLGG